MSISDLKHSLRKYEFPLSAKEALIRIEPLLVGRAGPSNKQLDIAIDIISEFVFCESDRRVGRRGGGLSPLQELQLIDIICDYLSACTNETTKNTMFLSLFGGMESQRRLKILSILASMAVSASSTPVLLAVGVWLQQMGCSSAQSLQLAENVIRDHFYLNTSNQIALRSLANTAPQFVSNFITAVTELYMHDVQDTQKIPPKNLLEVITSWVYWNPTLCMSAQLRPAALPSGAIPMAAVTPLAGLIRWCALAPLCPHYTDNDTEMVEISVPFKKIKLENELDCSVVKSVQQKRLTECELYIKLQLGVLQSLRAGRVGAGGGGGVGGGGAGGGGAAGGAGAGAGAVSAQHLAALAPRVLAYAAAGAGAGAGARAPERLRDQRLQDCLDRIGQAVQVALANGCVYGNINSLLASLDMLPEHRLLKIIIKTHQQAI